MPLIVDSLSVAAAQKRCGKVENARIGFMAGAHSGSPTVAAQGTEANYAKWNHYLWRRPLGGSVSLPGAAMRRSCFGKNGEL